MRIKRLDGLRAIAVMFLILFQHSFFDLGWTGGELFFVLSGYLMTKILRASRADESYWSRFYIKRTTRVVPVMLLILLLNKVATSHLPLIGLAGYALFMGDVAGVLGYSGGSLGALWAIAVGAHFVMLWSVAVRFLGRGVLMAIALGIVAVEPLIRSLATPYIHHFETFFTTPFHLDSLAAGSLLALLVEETEASRALARWSGWAAAVLAVGFLGVSHAFPWFIRVTNAPIYNSLGYATVTWIYFFLVAWVLAVREDGAVGKALSWAPLLYIAKISYGLALVHPFVIAILKRALHLPFGMTGEAANRKIFPVAIVASVALSALIFRLFEGPMRVWGKKQANRLEAQSRDPIRNEEVMVTGV